MENIAQHTAGAGHRAPRRRGSWIGRTLLVIAAISALIAIGLGAMIVFAPGTVERVYGTIRETILEVEQAVTGTLPRATLSGPGDLAALDQCDGTFLEMSYYGTEGIPPVWAAHNHCGGDIILGWQLGEIVELVGGIHDGTFMVVDIRETIPWADVDTLIGLRGTLALQSCYYDQWLMKFVGVIPWSTQPQPPDDHRWSPAHMVAV